MWKHHMFPLFVKSCTLIPVRLRFSLEILYIQNFLARAFGARAYCTLCPRAGDACKKYLLAWASSLRNLKLLPSVSTVCETLSPVETKTFRHDRLIVKKISHFEFWTKRPQKAVVHVFDALKGSENTACFRTLRKTALGRMQNLLLQMHLKV